MRLDNVRALVCLWDVQYPGLVFCEARLLPRSVTINNSLIIGFCPFSRFRPF